MKTFSTFLSEALLIERAPMTASGPVATDHVAKYLNPEMRKQHSYNTAKDTAGIPKGTPVKVKKVESIDNKYHAHVEHEGETKVIPINHLQKPGEYKNLSSEENQIKDIHDQISHHVKENGGKPVDLHIGGKNYKVASIHKVEGNVKADFALHDHNNKPVYYGSLKASAKGSGFNGYGGFSHMKNPSVHSAAAKLAKNIAEHPLNKGEMAFHKFNAGEGDHEHVVRQALFGKEVGSKNHGVSNINGVHHGKVSISKNEQGKLQLHSELDFHNTNQSHIIKDVEKAHGASVGIFVRKGEKQRKIPNTNILGRGGIGMSNMRQDASKVRPVK